MLFNMGLEFGAELTQKVRGGPGRGIRKSTDTFRLEVVGGIDDRRQVLATTLAALDTAQHPVHPSGALAALRTLSARLVLEEARDHQRRAHHAGPIVHHD